MGAQKYGPRVALVKNFAESKATWAVDMITSFERLIKRSSPNSSIEVFNAVLNDELPDPASFDIIILTGGTYNLAQEKIEAWVSREAEWVRQMAKNAPDTRLIGVCWGHQLIAYALGGSIEHVPNKHVVGKHPEQLTEAGKCLFDVPSLDLIHFRLRRVARPGSGSVIIAADNSMLFYPEGNILTFQGHPEFTSAVSHSILDGSGDAFINNMDEKELAWTRTSFDEANDGETVFAAVMDWAIGGRVIA